MGNLGGPLKIFHDYGPTVEVSKTKVTRPRVEPTFLKKLGRSLGLNVTLNF